VKEYDIESASVVKYDNRCVKNIDIVLLQVVEEQMVDDDVDRSKSDVFHIPVDDKKRECDKDMKMHLQTAQTLLYKDNRIRQQYKGNEISKKLTSFVVSVCIPGEEKEYTACDISKKEVMKKEHATE